MRPRQNESFRHVDADTFRRAMGWREFPRIRRTVQDRGSICDSLDYGNELEVRGHLSLRLAFLPTTPT